MEFLLFALCFALGGILKGATGAGAPIIAVPVLVLLYDVQTAVTVFAVPNLVPNLWQSWRYRADLYPPVLSYVFAFSGGVGMVVGTVMLARVPGEFLNLLVAVAVIAYIGFRLSRPGWKLDYKKAVTMVAPVGFVGGILQGSSGLSAPVSITFLNAMQPPREKFVATISLFFVGLGLVQLPLMIGLELMDQQRFFQSCLAVIPLLAFMPVGAFLSRQISRETFDWIILGLLGAIATKLLYQAVTSIY